MPLPQDDDALETEEKRDRAPDGRFLPGHSQPGPGRPKGSGIDLRSLAAAKAEELGVDLEGGLWEVLQGLLNQAKAGDVSAAKLLFTRLCLDDPKNVHLQVETRLNDVEAARQIESILATAEARRNGYPYPVEVPPRSAPAGGTPAAEPEARAVRAARRGRRNPRRPPETEPEQLVNLDNPATLRDPLDALPRELVERAQARWALRYNPGPADVLAVVDDGRGGFSIACRHGDWIASIVTRLQGGALVEELQTERTPVTVDPRGYGATLLAALRSRGMPVTEGDIDQALGRFLQALDARSALGEHAPGVALPPELDGLGLRASVLTFTDAPPPAAPSYFDDRRTLRREHHQPRGYDPYARKDLMP